MNVLPENARQFAMLKVNGIGLRGFCYAEPTCQPSERLGCRLPFLPVHSSHLLQIDIWATAYPATLFPYIAKKNNPFSYAEFSNSYYNLCMKNLIGRKFMKTFAQISCFYLFFRLWTCWAFRSSSRCLIWSGLQGLQRSVKQCWFPGHRLSFHPCFQE